MFSYLDTKPLSTNPQVHSCKSLIRTRPAIPIPTTTTPTAELHKFAIFFSLIAMPSRDDLSHVMSRGSLALSAVLSVTKTSQSAMLSV